MACCTVACNTILQLTCRQPSNAGGFRRPAFTKPINDKGKEKKQQVNPALRLSATRYMLPMKKQPSTNKLKLKVSSRHDKY